MDGNIFYQLARGLEINHPAAAEPPKAGVLPLPSTGFILEGDHRETLVYL